MKRAHALGLPFALCLFNALRSRFMYYHRILSFIVFTSAFFFITVSSSSLLFAGLSLYRRSDNSSTSSPPTLTGSIPSTPSTAPSTFKALDAEAHDAAEEAESRARRKEAARLSGRRMDIAEEEEQEASVLRHIKLEDDTSVAGREIVVSPAETGGEDSDETSSGSAVLVKAEDDGEQAAKAEDDDDNATLLGGVSQACFRDNRDMLTASLPGVQSATSVSGSRRSFGATSAATSATQASGSLRKRASGTSLPRKVEEGKDH